MDLASLLDRVSKSNKVKSKEDDFIPLPEHKGKRLIVRVWSSDQDNPHVLARKKIKFGQPEVSLEIGGRKRLYKINYRTAGMIKQDGKNFYYDTHFQNTVGGLAFHQFPEDMDAEEAYTAFKNNGVDMYVKKGGIPMKVLIVLGIVTAIAVAGLVIMSPYVASTQQTNDFDQKQLVKLSSMIDQLRAQVQNLGGKPIV